MNSLKKLVIFNPGILAHGGAERLTLEEAKYFGKNGVKTKILTFGLNKQVLSGYKKTDIDVINKKGVTPRLLSLRKKLKKIDPDLIISQSPTSCVYLYFATKFLDIPYITHIHGTMFWFHIDLLKYALIHKKVFREIRESVIGHKEFIPPNLPKCGLVERLKIEIVAILEYLAVRNAKSIIVLTNQLKLEVKKLYDRDAIVSRGCLDPKILSYKQKYDIRKKLGLDDKKIILNIGRLGPRKRIDLLIKSFAKSCQKHQDTVLLIGGMGEEEKRLRELAKDLCVEEKVKFLGFVKDSEYLDYFAACDVFAFPSWTSSGIPPYEALAMGKNVVWTTEAEEPVLSNRHVFLAEPTVEDFTKAMEKALNIKIEEKVDLSDYTWDKYFSKVKAVCEKIVKVRR